MNYVAPMLMLMEHYKTSGDVQKLNKWKDLVLFLAEKAGKKDQILRHINEKGLE